MASVCDPFTGQCHCKVSRVLGPGHFPKSPSWAPFLYHLLPWRHCPQQPFWVSGASWKLLAEWGEGGRGDGGGGKTDLWSGLALSTQPTDLHCSLTP